MNRQERGSNTKTASSPALFQDLIRRSRKPPWSPSFSVAFRLLVLMRFCAAIYSNISDCDEVYNFWEPLHFLHHGYGFQTWELSPMYAIRSWAYVIIHLGPLQILSQLFQPDKRTLFFTLRVIFAFTTSFAEAKFYRAVSDHVHIRVGRYMLFLLLCSAGMWNASTAFLPSTFTLYTTTLASSYTMQLTSSRNSRRTSRAVSLFALGAIVAWPFAIAVALPFVLEELFVAGIDSLSPVQYREMVISRLLRLFKYGLFASILLGSTVAIDSFMYGRFSIVPWNIVKYNLFGGPGKGPDIYGTEPWYFYGINLTLNFNLAAFAALVSLPALLVTSAWDRKRLTSFPNGQTPAFTSMAIRLSPFYVWITILSIQPHKEERFMFPIYSLLCFNAAVTLFLVRGWLETCYVKATKSPYRASQSGIFSRFTLVAVLISSSISVSRIFAVTWYYHSPLSVVFHLQRFELPRVLNAAGLLAPNLLPDGMDGTDAHPIDLTPIKVFDMTVCLGKEWYRFPSHYLIPNGLRVEFIKSNFEGLLPSHFADSVGNSLLERAHKTRIVPKDLNDLNKEEHSHYVKVDSCDYLIDSFDPGADMEIVMMQEPAYALDTKKWERVFCSPFLNAHRTPTIYRMLWLPGEWWHDQASWNQFCLLKNKRLSEAREKRRWSLLRESI